MGVGPGFRQTFRLSALRKAASHVKAAIAHDLVVDLLARVFRAECGTVFLRKQSAASDLLPHCSKARIAHLVDCLEDQQMLQSGWRRSLLM